MKKFIFSAIAAIGLLLSPSCSDENEALSGSGNEALVSFSVNLADGIQTKATIGDGTKAKNLVVDVFEKNTTNDEYTQVGGLRQKHDGAFSSSLTKTVNFDLVKGKTYRLIFWAQAQSVVNPPNSPYKISDLSKITVDYSAGITNDEDRDAFLYATGDITVSGNFTKSITMTRPFAQLNYLIDEDEYNAAKAAGMNIQKAKVTVAKVATELYPLKNSVGGSAEDVTFEITDIPTTFANLSSEDYIYLPQPGAQTPTNKNYYYLASKYFLVYAGDGAENKAGVSATLATTSLKLQDTSGDIANYEFKVPAVPVQRNYRTNIYGNLITSEGTFNVTIDKNFNTPDNDLPQYAAVVNSAGEIYSAIVNDKATTIIASESFPLSTSSTAPTTITVPRTYASGNNGVELTFDLSKATVTSGTAEITITQGTSATDTQSLPENVNVIASGNITINLPTSHVTLNGNEVSGGTYNTVTATTSGTTLVVPNGVTVETLNVKKGNVRIEKGGKVGTIVRTVDNEDIGKKTIVFLEDGGELGNINAITDPKIIVVQPSIISTAAELMAFAESVNKGYTYAGETVVLTADIDLNGVEWTPIGQKTIAGYSGGAFAGTFDGQNHTISNLTASSNEANWASAGLFGTVTSATIKNVKLSNVNVSSTHYVGAIVGYHSAETFTVENCHVDGGTITSTIEAKSDGSYDNGDKAGGIVGYTTNGTIKNCSVSNVTIKAYRDLGGIVGCAAGTVTNNNVNGLTLIIDATHDYKANSYVANANPIVGRQESGFTDGGGNTATNVVYQVASETALKQALNYNPEKIELLGDIELTSQLGINKDVTIQGGGIKGKAVHVGATNDVVFKNVAFKDVTNENNKASSLYAAGFQGNLTIDGCTFEGFQWDAIQTTPKDGAKITVINNTFVAPAESGGAKRYLHIEADASEGSDATIKVVGNRFGTVANLGSAIDIDYIKALNQLTVGKNTFADDKNVMVSGEEIYICLKGSSALAIPVGNAYDSFTSATEVVLRN